MNINRRELLAAVGSSAAALSLGAIPPPALGAQPPSRHRALRIAFLTDIHLQPEGRAVEGFTACLRHAQSLKPKPDLILCGGDAIMDCFGADKARTQLQWELWKKVLANECSLPLESCIGNHDIWGGNRKRSRTTGEELLYGRKWAMEVFGITSPYRSLDRAGWHFIFLDSTLISGDGQGDATRMNFGYVGQLDAEQFAWLEADLQRVPRETPVCIISHIPIVSVAAFFTGATGKEDLIRDGNWVVPGGWVHVDAKRFKQLFTKHRNVKLCLSGHLHLQDRVDYNGVSYLCNGAVCGAWWKGPLRECREGYALVDLFNDGSFVSRYLDYDWTAAR